MEQDSAATVGSVQSAVYHIIICIPVTDIQQARSTAVEYTTHCMVIPLHAYCGVWSTDC